MKIPPRLRKKYLTPDGRFKDPRTKEQKFEQCVWQVVKSNQRTIVKHDPVRTCLRNIYEIQSPMTDSEIVSKIASLEAQEKTGYLTYTSKGITSDEPRPLTLQLTAPQEKRLKSVL